jgi:hypothetical protein
MNVFGLRIRFQLHRGHAGGPHQARHLQVNVWQPGPFVKGVHTEIRHFLEEAGVSDPQKDVAEDEARVLLERELALLQSSSLCELRSLIPHKLAREYVGLNGNKYAIMIWTHDFGDEAVRIVLEIYRDLGPDGWSECLAGSYLVASSDGGREAGPLESASGMA